MAKIAFLFPGQGAQTVGMARDLCASLPAARSLFERAATVLGYDLLAVCADGPKDRLDSTAVSQPAIYVASLAALEQLRTTEPDAAAQCVASAGLSLGEYTALTFAGAMSFEDGLHLVQKRGEAMQDAADARPSTMISILLLEVAQVQEFCDRASRLGLVRIANYLCPGNLVISGDTEACEEAEKLAAQAGAKTIRLAVAGAFHTPVMQTAVERLNAALAGVALKKPQVPVWANVTARAYVDADEVRATLARQVVEPVRWEDTMRAMLDAGVERFYEIGPGRVLAGLLKRINRKIECRNVTA
ncbi:MAG: [acyl-carrier-protein] S-malonyltransferase [Planctomycetia bacterium]|nr:[acyl-carrier-protein] S-malonyltransferase [Planctomycetia bacterium]